MNFTDPSQVLKVGQKVKVHVLENSATRFGLSMKRVRPVLASDFHPITVMIIGWPVEMDEEESYSFFCQYGHVEDVAFIRSSIVELGDRYKYIFVTFRNRDMALECLKNCRTVSVEIGKETYDYRLRARMAKEQSFKKRLQADLDEAFELIRKDWDMTPETRRVERMARRDLQRFIPYYDDFDRSRRERAHQLLDINEHRMQ